MSDRDIKNWDARLAEQVQKKYENYIRRRINLDMARDRGLYAIAGEFIYVEKVNKCFQLFYLYAIIKPNCQFFI